MIEKEQIESTFRKEEEFNRKCGVFAEIICRLLKLKAVPSVLAIIIIITFIYIFCADSISGIFLRAGKVIAGTAVLIIVVYAGIMINVLAVHIHERKKNYSPVKWIYPQYHSYRLKRELEKEPAKAEKKLLSRIEKNGIKPAMLFDLVVYFNYCQSEKPERCRDIFEQAEKLRGIDNYFDRIIISMEYSLALSETNAAETVRIYEENEKIFSEDAFETAEKLIVYLNNRGEYFFAKGRFDTALELFLEKKECVCRYIELFPDKKTAYADNLALDEQDIAKCYEKLDMPDEAQKHIRMAEEAAAFGKKGDIKCVK